MKASDVPEELKTDKMNRTYKNFSTLAVHAAEDPDPATGAVAPILVRTKTFAQEEFGVESEFQYSRGKNPTRLRLERKLALLEGGGNCVTYASGLAAETAFFLTLSPRDHVLCCQEVYGGTFRLLDRVLGRFGVTHDFVDFGSEQSILAAVRPNTKYLFVETPTNPSLHIVDLALVGRVSKETGVPFVVDATFSPPCATRPFDYGAEVVIHSMSKYIAGHNDILGGALITRNEALHEQFFFHNTTLGAVLSPDECYRVLQEIKTLELRWRRVSETGLEVARALASEKKKVKKVLYPGLPSHPGHEVAVKQMKGGFGGVVSFELYEEKVENLKKFVDRVKETSPIIYGESLASPETILAYPPLMSHKSLPVDVRRSLGIGDGFFRLSVGFEDAEDLLHGLQEGLKAI